MEPQLIDYYNEMPFGIDVIERMNVELSELQKKYDELEKEHQVPQIIFTSNEEFTQKHEEMYNEINKTCATYFDDFEYRFMEGHGITPRQSAHLTFTIDQELTKITNDISFSYEESYKIMKPLRSIFRGHEVPHWDKIIDNLTKDELKDIFYDTIINYIKEHTTEKYALFKCHECDKIVDYTEKNKCLDCGNGTEMDDY